MTPTATLHLHFDPDENQTVNDFCGLDHDGADCDYADGRWCYDGVDWQNVCAGSESADEDLGSVYVGWAIVVEGWESVYLD